MAKPRKGGKNQSGQQTRAVLGKKGKARTPEEAIAATNPKWGTAEEYGVNCQRCVLAYEMQRRGYNVEALPRVLDGTDPMDRRWENGFEGQKWTKPGELGTRNTTVEQSIISKMSDWGDGSRAIVYVAWKSGSAHVFNVENRGGNVSIFEAQTGKKYSLGEYLNISKPSRTTISRVDNLKPNLETMGYAVKRK